MFDKYMICEGTLRNVPLGQRPVAFEFGARLAYYRGLGLSMIEDLAVSVDGEKMPRDKVRLTVAKRTYTLDELETEYDAVWNFGEMATITVLRDGGLTTGEHRLELAEQLRVSYMPFPITGRDAKTVRVA